MWTAPEYHAMLKRHSTFITREEEADLLRLVHSPGGDVDPLVRETAINRLICANIRFVYSVTCKYSRPGMSHFDDLFSEACDGLRQGILGFKAAKIGELKLISYAVWWIRQRIQAEITRQRTEGFSGCSGVLDRSARLKKQMQALESENKDVPDKLVTRSLQMDAAVGGRHLRLDAPVVDDGQVQRELADVDAHESILRDVDVAHTNGKIIRELFEGEDPLLVQILTLRFGLNGLGEELTFEEISHALLQSGHKTHVLSRERVRQIINKGMKKLAKRATLLGYSRHSFQAEDAV